MAQTAKRERLVSWQDPLIGAQKAQQMAGLDYLQALAAGEIPPPPISNLVNMHLGEVSEGKALFLLEPDESHYNPIGSVHGGIIATACDSAASCAVHTTLEQGQAYTTAEMKVNYIRPIMASTGTIQCRGEVIHRGRRLATASARLEDEKGKLYAHASVTCLIFPIS